MELGVLELGVLKLGVMELGVLELGVGYWKLGVLELGVLELGVLETGVLELVAAVVDGRYVHRQDVLAATLQISNLHLERRKHSPAHGPRTAAISSHNYQLSLIDPRDGIVL